MSFLSKLFNKTDSAKPDFAELLSNGALLIDVRSPAEFARGSIKGAENIPLGDVGKQIERFQKAGKPVIACCASGMRSGNATNQLKAAGVEAYNGGGWQFLQSQIGK